MTVHVIIPIINIRFSDGARLFLTQNPYILQLGKATEIFLCSDSEAQRINEINTQHHSEDGTQTHQPEAISVTLTWPYSVIVPSSPLRG